jgi:hypothetical protein
MKQKSKISSLKMGIVKKKGKKKNGRKEALAGSSVKIDTFCSIMEPFVNSVYLKYS